MIGKNVNRYLKLNSMESPAIFHHYYIYLNYSLIKP